MCVCLCVYICACAYGRVYVCVVRVHACLVQECVLLQCKETYNSSVHHMHRWYLCCEIYVTAAVALYQVPPYLKQFTQILSYFKRLDLSKYTEPEHFCDSVGEGHGAGGRQRQAESNTTLSRMKMEPSYCAAGFLTGGVRGSLEVIYLHQGDGRDVY